MKILTKFKKTLASISLLALLSTFLVPFAQAQEMPPPPPEGPPPPMENSMGVAYVDRSDDNFSKVIVGFMNDMSIVGEVEEPSRYILHHGESSVNPSNVTRLGGYEVELDFSGLLGPDDVTCGYQGDNLEMLDLMANPSFFPINCMMGDMGGFFGPDVVVNEVVTSPQGGGYEFIELRINADDLNLVGDQVNVFRGGFGPNETHVIKCTFNSGPGCDNNDGGQGKANTVEYVSENGGAIGNTKKGDFIILKNFTAVLEDNDYIEYMIPSEYMVEDSVALGTFNDGYTDDNASSGASTGLSDQAVGRDKFGTLWGANSEDFYKQAATPGADNEYVPAFKVLGVFSMGNNRIGLDFNQSISSSIAIPENFVVKNSQNTTLAVSNVYSYGPYVDLELAEGVLLSDGQVYTVTIKSAITGGDDFIAEMYVMGSNDQDAPFCSSAEVKSPTEIKVYCWDENGLDTTGTTASVSGGRTVLDVDGFWDHLVVHLNASTPLENGENYTLIISGLKDNITGGGNPNTAQDIYLPISYNMNDGGTNEFFEVLGSSPSDNTSAPLNLSSLSVQFSKPVEASTLSVTGEGATLKLYEFDWDTWGVTGDPITLSSVSYNSDKQTAIITNETILSANTTYELNIVGEESGIKSIYGETMPSHAIWFTTTAENDTTKPTVLETSIDSYSSSNPLPVSENRIRIYFSEAMDSTTISSTNLNGNAKICTFRSGEEYCLSGEVWYDNQSNAAEILLREPLQANTDYTLTVATGVKDVAGNVLASRFTRSVTTGGAITSAPVFEGLDCSTDRCYVKFDRGMGSSASVLGNYTLTANGNSVNLGTANANYHDFDNALEITGLGLTPGAQIRLTAKNGIMDYMGNTMSQGSYIENYVIDDSFFMNQGFWIENVYPDWGIFNVPTNTSILVQFSDGMAADTLSNITIKPIQGYSMAGYPVTGSAIDKTITYITNSRIAKITPAAPLSANTEYEIKIPTSVKSSSGQSLPYDEFRSFMVNGSTDSVAPTVSMYNVPNGQIDVPVGIPEIFIKFSEAMGPASLNTANVTVKETVSGTQVLGDIEYHLWDNSISFVPRNVLSANTGYTITLTTGVKDLAGNALASQQTSAFTTGAADVTSPTVDHAWSDGWMMGIKFSEHLDQNSIALANISLNCDGVSKVISDKSYWYEPWNYEVMIEGLSLTPGQNCTVTANKVKDLSGNVINTEAKTASFTVQDVTNKFEGNRVVYSLPSPGQPQFAPNTGVIELGFQNPVNPATVSNSTIQLFPVQNNGQLGSQVNATSFDLSSDKRSVYAHIPSLDVDKEYRLMITTSITDDKGNPLMPFDAWGNNTATAYDIYFHTDLNNDTTGPMVWGTSLDQFVNPSTGAALNVPLYLPIRIQFSKNMNTSTVADANTLNEGSNIQVKDNGGNPIQGDVTYMPDEQAAYFTPADIFTAGEDYTLYIGTGVKDVVGNALANPYTLAFTVTATADTTKPTIAHTECEEFECRIFFSEPVKKTQAENILNYSLKSPSSIAVNLSSKKVTYYESENMAVIQDLTLKPNDFFFLTVQNIEDKTGNAMDTGTDNDVNSPRNVDETLNKVNEWEGNVWTNYNFFDNKFDKSAMVAGTANFLMDKMGFGMMAGGFHVEPMNKTKLQETMWFIDIPVDQVIPEGSYLQLKFQSDHVLSGVTKPNNCITNPGPSCSPVNNDINGPGPGTLTFTVDSYNQAAKTVTLKLQGGATGANDFLTIDLNGIKTPSTKGDYTVELSILKSDKTYLAGPYTSDTYSITGGGSSTIQGTITGVGIPDGQPFSFELGSPWSGVFSTTSTFSGGTATYKFQSLQAGDYNLMFSPVVNFSGKDYRAPMSPMLHVGEGETKTYNLTLDDLSGATDSQGNTLRELTVNVNGADSLSGKKGTIELGNWMNWFEKDFTFNAQGQAAVTFSVPEGQYNVNVFPYVPKFMAGPPPEQAFMSPSSKFTQVSGTQDGEESGVDQLTMNIVVPNNYIQVTVKDESQNGVPNVDVFCNNPESPTGGSGGRTGSDGTKTLKVTPGDYNCDVFVPGMGNLNKRISVSTVNNQSNPALVAFIIKIGNLSRISGTVVSGTEKISNAPVWCDKVDSNGNFLPGWTDAMTDGNGKWSVLVDNGSWRCQAGIPGYGDTDPITKTVASADISGVTLSPPSNTITITGTVLVNGSAPTQGGGVFAEKEGIDPRFSDTRIESDGSFTLRVKQSASATYRVGVFVPGVVDKIVQTGVAVASNVNLGTIDVSSGGALSTITVNLTGADGVTPFSTSKAFVEISGSNGSNYQDFQGSSTTLSMANGDNYKVKVFVKEQGPLTEKTVNINGNQTLTFSLSATPITISGTVNDAGTGNPLGGAFVTVSNAQTGFKVDVQTASNGTYQAIVPPNTTYNIAAQKTGYLMAPAVGQVVTTQNVTKNFSLSATSNGITITGTAYLGTGNPANNNAMVVANCASGDSANDSVDDLGIYSITLSNNSNTSCVLEAFADGYATTNQNKLTIVPSVSQAGKNITATSTGQTLSSAKFSVNTDQPVKVSNGNFQLSGPSAAFNSTQGTLNLTKKETGKIPKVTKNGNIMGNGFELLATDATGSVELAKPVTVTVPYPEGMTDVQAASANAAYLGSNGNWVDLPTIVDTVNDQFRFTTDHFTIFGVKTNSDAAAPDAPTGLGATAGDGQVVLDWADNSESDLKNYNIYRSTTTGFSISNENQVNTSEVTSSNYTDTTVTNGTKYYYVVTAVDTSDNESDPSSEANATPTGSGEEQVNTSNNTGGGGTTKDTIAEDNTYFADEEEDEAVTDEEVVVEEDTDEATNEFDVETVLVDSDNPLALATPDYEGHWAEEYIKNVMNLGIAQGIAPNRFDPDSQLTRAQLTKMVVIAAGYEIPETVEETSFSDVKTTDWFAPYIEVAKDAGLVEGYSQWYFRPNQPINRAEALKILVEGTLGRKIALDPSQGLLGNFELEQNPFADLDLDEWYAVYALYAYKYGIVSGYADGSLGPDNYMTRAEFAKVISIALES